MSNSLIESLKVRGLVDGITSPLLEEKLKSSSLKVYIGFDPTADSLHLGNLVGIIMLRWFQDYGHTPVVILGGATGRVGDPSGKSVERPLLSLETIQNNIEKIGIHFQGMLNFSSSYPPLILNNDSWLGSMPLLDFLRDVGKHFRLGAMLGKESVRIRLESEEGMSFTEFSYQLLQSYDFHHLCEYHGVNLQMGGSDQWGNICGGIDLVRKLSGKEVFGLTFPLLTRSDGKKFGKTEQGAIWLSKEKCSPYQFYQYLMGIPDLDVIKLLKVLTFLPLKEINALEESMKEEGYIPNTTQKKLAEEVTRFVHGEEGLLSALKATGAMPGMKISLDPETLSQIKNDMPYLTFNKEEIVGKSFVDIAVKIGMGSSRGEVTRLIKGGGAYLNEEKVMDAQLILQDSHLIGGIYLIFSAGKKKKILLEIG